MPSTPPLLLRGEDLKAIITQSSDIVTLGRLSGGETGLVSIGVSGCLRRRAARTSGVYVITVSLEEKTQITTETSPSISLELTQLRRNDCSSDVREDELPR